MASKEHDTAAEDFAPSPRPRSMQAAWAPIVLQQQMAAWRENWPRVRERYRAIREACREVRAEARRTRERAGRLRDEARQLGRRDR